MRGILNLELLCKRTANCLHSTRKHTSEAGEIEHEHAATCLLYAYQYYCSVHHMTDPSSGFFCPAELSIAAETNETHILSRADTNRYSLNAMHSRTPAKLSVQNYWTISNRQHLTFVSQDLVPTSRTINVLLSEQGSLLPQGAA